MWASSGVPSSGKPISIRVKGLIVLGVFCQLLGAILLWNKPNLVRSWGSSNPDGLELMSTAQDESIWVDVAGAVETPGVYRLSEGSLVADALELAGGLSSTADSGYVRQDMNLAQELKNGYKLYIPSVEEKKYRGDLESWCQSQLKRGGDVHLDGELGGLVSINSASQTELMSLSGIGEVRATDIIQNRPYASLDELEAKGVLGSGLLEDLRQQLGL
jgi:competence protein ComEA